jgi:hypothetical protein
LRFRKYRRFESPANQTSLPNVYWESLKLICNSIWASAFWYLGATMKHPLSASDLKIQRARKHLIELETASVAFVSSRPVRFKAASLAKTTWRANAIGARRGQEARSARVAACS